MHTICQLQNFFCLYQDKDIAAFHKPAGLLMHPSPIDKRETQFAVHLAQDHLNQAVYPVHRLDKPTSGIILFALSPQSARNLGAQFSQHTIEKTYLALTRGWLTQPGVLDRPLRYQADKYADKDRQSAALYQEAITRYHPITQTTLDYAMGDYQQQRYSLVELKPQTGRKHQLRRHLNYLKHPIIGDVRHGDRHHNHLFYEQFGYHRLYLAATQLSFIHPTTQLPVTLNCPLENTFSQTLTQLTIPEETWHA